MVERNISYLNDLNNGFGTTEAYKCYQYRFNTYFSNMSGSE